jgi:hypothetical protein
MKTMDLSLAEAAIEEYVINLLNTQRENKQMPGRYESNIAEVVAGFVVFPKNEYTVEVGEPKAAEYNTKDGLKAGVRFPLRIADGEFKGKTVSYFGDELNEFGKAANKRLVMAALGYENKEESEKRFNEEVGTKHSWGFNTSEGTVDEGWLLAKGKALVVDLDVNVATDGSGKQYQKFVSFRPIAATAPAAA